MSTSMGNEGPKIGVIMSDATSSANRFVQGDTTNTTINSIVVKAATADTQIPLGITTKATTEANEPSSIQIYGLAEIEMNGTTVDIGSQLVAAAGGKGAVATAEDQAAQYSGWVAMAPSTADEDIIPCLFWPSRITEGQDD